MRAGICFKSTPRGGLVFLNGLYLKQINKMTASSSTHAFSALCVSFCVLADEERSQLDSCSSMASLSLPWSSVSVSGCECSPLCFCWKLLTLCIEKPVSVIAFITFVSMIVQSRRCSLNECRCWWLSLGLGAVA